MQLLETGSAPYLSVDPDGHREWVRTHKSRRLTSKLMSGREAVERFVSDGDYLVYDCNYFQRGPASLLREIIRQQKRDLWLCGKFTYVDVSLLVGAHCASQVDVGFFGRSKVVEDAVRSGAVRLYEYSNITMTLRLRAGASGLPFLPVRSFGGTDGFAYSGARLVQDPFTEEAITLLPALNPDVAIVHVHQADAFGNARVFGTGIAHVEAALASKKVIVSAEEIVPIEEMRRNPGANSIPYFAVDAVVDARFGAYPGTVAGRYAADSAHVTELYGALARGTLDAYLDKWIYSVESDEEMLAERVGLRRLLDLEREETIREGYRA